MTTAHQAYQLSSVQTASPGQLVVMLFDGCLRFLRRAEAAAKAGQPAELTAGVNRATAIIMELNATLDMEAGGEISTNLRNLYVFLQRHLLDAARESDAHAIRQAIGIVAELRSAFATAARQAAA